MKIMWDELKRNRNLDKHGFNFADFEIEDLVGATIQNTHSNRYKAIIKKMDMTLIVIFAYLGKEAISIISMRQANKKEREQP